MQFTVQLIKQLKSLVSALSGAKGKYCQLQKVLKIAKGLGFKVPKLNGYKKDLMDAAKAIARLAEAAIDAFEAVSKVVSPVVSLLSVAGLLKA